MSKLKLDLDKLQIETFSTAEVGEDPGTVYGNLTTAPCYEGPTYTCKTCWGPTCRDTCQQTCFLTCPVSCQGSCIGQNTCYNTCPTCLKTCWDYTCHYAVCPR